MFVRIIISVRKYANNRENEWKDRLRSQVHICGCTCSLSVSTKFSLRLLPFSFVLQVNPPGAAAPAHLALPSTSSAYFNDVQDVSNASWNPEVNEYPASHGLDGKCVCYCWNVGELCKPSQISRVYCAVQLTDKCFNVAKRSYFDVDP